MPRPSSTTIQPRPDLAGSMQEYPIAAAGAGAIAYELFPVIEVPVQSGKYGSIPPEQLLTPKSRKRNSDGSYARSEFEFSERDWSTDEYGGEGIVDERRANQYREYFDAELVTAQIEQFKNIQAAEIRAAAIAMNTSNFSGQTTAAGTAWTSYSSADPVANVETAVQAVYGRDGLWPNVGWCSMTTLRNLRHCDKVIERIEASGAGQPAKFSDVTVEMIAQVFGLQKILVGGMSKNTANINQTKSISGVWSNSYFGVGYIDLSKNIEMPTLFRAFHWGADGSTIGGRVESYYDDRVRADVIRVRHDTDEKQVLSTLGQLITGCV